MRDVQVRRGSYVDSVALMQVSRRVSSLDGVTSALVAMATDLNLELLDTMGFEVPDASANEMLVAIDAATDEVLHTARTEVDAALAESARPGASVFGAAPPPVTVRGAAARADATFALISTPGQSAFADALDAVEAGLHTMVFSDNVPVEQEVLLKVRAGEAGVLVMGPDCGTAVIGGVGLGFANVVRPGPVGIVAASGTGAQHLMALLDGAGVGVSHCLGVGGRDLSAAVGGRSTHAALDLLDADEDTGLVVVVSKPPDAAVADEVREHAASLRTPVHLGLLGRGQPDLTALAGTVAEAAGGNWTAPESWPGDIATGRVGGHLRGLFVGGTLCDEAMVIASETLGEIASNIPLDPAWALGDDLRSRGHTMIDFGDDRLTRGRPHPMIDGSVRAARIRAEVDDQNTAVLLLDVLLGLGAEADPAALLAPAVAHATAADVPVVVSVTGTRDDPQGLREQVAALTAAGAWVCLSNAAATRTAVGLLEVQQP